MKSLSPVETCNPYTFSEASAAVDFIAQCLEEAACIRLLAQIDHVGRFVAPAEIPYIDQFRAAFLAMARLHDQIDLRAVYQGVMFPTNGDIYRMGGPLLDEAGVVVDFVRKSNGWRLSYIGVTQPLNDAPRDLDRPRLGR